MRTSWIYSLLVIGVAGCKHAGGSAVREAPDQANQPANLGIAPPYAWKEIKERTKASVKPAWSDSYWPLESRGLALRWAADPVSSTQDDTLATTLKSLQSVLKSKDMTKIALLSPAEKYDILVGKPDQIAADLTADIEKIDQAEEKALGPKLKAWRINKTALVTEMRLAMMRVESLQTQMNALNAEAEQAVAAKKPEVAEAARKKFEGLLQELATLGTKVGEIAQKLQVIRDEERMSRKEFIAQTEPALMRLNAFLPMTSEAWNVWTRHEASDAADYGWMGHCHGWAAASIMEKKPEHGVLVRKGDLSVLFTEGDIRGLLTKVWADHAQPNKVTARRCQSDELPRDSRGRVEDGRICFDQKTCEAKAGSPIFIENNMKDRGLIEYRDGKHFGKSHFAYLVKYTGGDQYETLVFDRNADLAGWIEAGQPSSFPGARPAALHLTIGCRDVNPMTLHLALTKLIAEKKHGFIFDRDQTSQVWNQPVFGYDLEYVSLPLKKPTAEGETVSKAGEPAPIGDVADHLGPFRAPGTAYLVGIMANINFGDENGPRATYDRSGTDEHSSGLEVSYTLELDKNLNIIGGEWGQIPPPGSKDEELSGMVTPDFLWYPGADKPVAAGLWNLDLINKIHACSLAKTDLKSIKIKMADYEKQTLVPQTIKYTECSL